jgi:hypothetical protein
MEPELQPGKMERVLEMDGGDGCPTPRRWDKLCT